MTSILHCLTHSVAGGAQQVVFQLVRALLRGYPGLKHTIMLPPGGVFVERFRSLGLSILEMPLTRLSAATAARVQAAIRPGRFDILHSHGKGAGIYARFLTPGGTKVRRIHSFHGVHPPTQPLARRFYAELERRLAAVTERFVGVSVDEARDIVEFTGVEPARVTVIPNVADCVGVRAAAAEPLAAHLAALLPAPGAGFIVSMIARRDPLKNHELAFEAVGLLLEQVPSAVVVFAGVPESDSEFAKLKSRFPHNVVAITDLENAAPLISRSDVVLLTSRKEAGPLVVLEAFCLGKPVVATNVPGIRGQVAHRRNGLLCMVNAASVADALIELATNAVTYEALRENAGRAGSAIDVDAWAAQYARIYTSGVA